MGLDREIQKSENTEGAGLSESDAVLNSDIDSVHAAIPAARRSEEPYGEQVPVDFDALKIFVILTILTAGMAFILKSLF